MGEFEGQEGITKYLDELSRGEIVRVATLLKQFIGDRNPLSVDQDQLKLIRGFTIMAVKSMRADTEGRKEFGNVEARALLSAAGGAAVAFGLWKPGECDVINDIYRRVGPKERQSINTPLPQGGNQDEVSGNLFGWEQQKWDYDN